MPESVFTQTMPFAFAGGAWCSLVVALVEAFDELPELDGGAVLLAAESSAGDDVDDDALGDDVGAVLRDAELPAGDAACVSGGRQKGVTIGAWVGVFFALAIIALAGAILVRSPETPKANEHAQAPTITLPSDR